MEEWQYHDWMFINNNVKDPKNFWQIDCSDIRGIYSYFGDMVLRTSHGSYKISSEILLEIIKGSEKALLATKKISRRHIVDIRNKGIGETLGEEEAFLPLKIYEDDFND